MDFKKQVLTFIETVKDKIVALKEDIQDFIEDNKTISLIILVITVLVLILLILLSISFNSSKKAKKTSKENQAVTLTEELLLPKPVAAEDNYILSRITGDKWSSEEAEEWFNIPSEQEIDNLSKTNDKLVKDILRAAP